MYELLVQSIVHKTLDISIETIVVNTYILILRHHLRKLHATTILNYVRMKLWVRRYYTPASF